MNLRNLKYNNRRVRSGTVSELSDIPKPKSENNFLWATFRWKTQRRVCKMCCKFADDSLCLTSDELHQLAVILCVRPIRKRVEDGLIWEESYQTSAFSAVDLAASSSWEEAKQSKKPSVDLTLFIYAIYCIFRSNATYQRR